MGNLNHNISFLVLNLYQVSAKINQKNNQLKRTIMKTAKSILITALLVFAGYGFSYTPAESTQTTPEISYDKVLHHISIKHAEHIPSLSSAIRHQVDPRIFQNKIKRYYSFHIIDRDGEHYMVYGPYNDWKMFFRL